MEAIREIEAGEHALVSALEADVNRAKRIATLMDGQVSVFGFRIGIDPLVGLIPIVGDTIGLVIGMYPIYVAHKHRLGAQVESLMALNLVIDTAVGLIPILGDVFDAMFRANLKNFALLEGAARRAFSSSSRRPS